MGALPIRFSTVLAIAVPYAFASELDDMWLRYYPVSDAVMLAEYRSQLKSVVVTGDEHVLVDSIQVAQLQTAAEELGSALTKLLAWTVPSRCCTSSTTGSGILSVSVGTAHAELGPEGFRIDKGKNGTIKINAKTASGALYGSFRLLTYVQLGKRVPKAFTSIPAMKLRVWDLWDTLDGSITPRSYTGESIVWPMALWDLAKGEPARNKLYVAPCNESDPYQRWAGDALLHPGLGSTLINEGNRKCLSWAPNDGSMGPCSGTHSTFFYNSSTLQISNSTGTFKKCLDLPFGWGSDVGKYSCHGTDEVDIYHQQFIIDHMTGLIHSIGAKSQCLTLSNSQPPRPYPVDPKVPFLDRFAAMLRLIKSSGMNGLALNDVNADPNLLRSPQLVNVTRNLAPTMERWGITPYISVPFGAPTVIDNITSDPLSPLAKKWWADKASEIYSLMPGFGGFLIKADSEGNLGPLDYNRTQADGANLLAEAVKPHGGIVKWRAFVYGNADFGTEDIARQSYDTFKPLDGMFHDNVVLQIKNGPMDFQIREPLHPLFGAMRHTNIMMEVQASQQETGQGIHAVNLVTMWKEYLDFDMQNPHPGAIVYKMLSNKTGLSGMAAVSNFGSFGNWTGHVLAGANTYGFGRLSWDPRQSAESINREWSAMTFPRTGSKVVETVTSILQRSRDIYEGYAAPLGIGYTSEYGTIAQGGGACAPTTGGPGKGPGGAECTYWPLGPPAFSGQGAGESHYWMDPCANYGSSNYSAFGLGCDRTFQHAHGSGMAWTYAPSLRDLYINLETCPTNLLLWFHNLPWTYPMRSKMNNRTVSLFEFIKEGHVAAVEEAQKLADDWKSLEGLVDDERFYGVEARFKQQIHDAAVFRDTIINYYTYISNGDKGIPPLSIWI